MRVIVGEFERDVLKELKLGAGGVIGNAMDFILHNANYANKACSG